jgi:hypothetical protein
LCRNQGEFEKLLNDLTRAQTIDSKVLARFCSSVLVEML